MNNGKFFAGLALGALVGSALSCFAHSNRGRKLRRDIYDTIQDLEEDAYDFAHRAKHKAEKTRVRDNILKSKEQKNIQP
uniref:YtxH domain-containing protein n=1 Tax=Phocaeicola massiliensis TaxID=204516 RepID=UPI002FD9F722